MDEPRPRQIHPLLWIPLSILVLLGIGQGYRAYLVHRKEVAAKDYLVQEQALQDEERCAQATALQVWAAGARGSDGRFCPPCTYNPTMLLEISDPSEVREFLLKFRFRRKRSDEEETKMCGPITIDFIRDQRILHSCNLKPIRLEDESWRFVQSWLHKRDLMNKADAARSSSPVAPKKDP